MMNLRSNVDPTMISSCAWKSKTSKRDHPNQATPTIGIGRIRETRSLPTLETFSGSRLKTIKKALIPKISLKNLPILHLNPVSETLAQIIKMAGVATEKEVMGEAEINKEKSEVVLHFPQGEL
jgi:hypothetical protein